MRRKLSGRSLTLSLVVPATIAFTVALPTNAFATTAASASSDAYGLLVDAKLLAANLPVHAGPLSRASQDFPPGAAAADVNSVASAGPLPSDGSLVQHVGVMTTTASAIGTPQAVASAETADVSLLGMKSGPVISADVVKAVANSNCTTAPNATGTTFVNLTINGTPMEGSPPANTVIDLGIAKVILNEQHPASDGRGIVVNAIHVISTTAGDPLFRGDIVVSHAMSTVTCPNGAGSTGGDNPIQITKSVSATTANPGDTLTYTVGVTNKDTSDCLITELIDHLPPGFTYVSTSGTLGTKLDVNPPTARPNGGLDLAIGNGHVLASKGTLTQTFTVKVGAHQPGGTYFNNVELYCANLGEFVKGLDAPVTVPAAPTTSGTGTTTTATTTGTAAATAGAGDNELASTGPDSAALVVMLTGLLGTFLLLMRVRQLGRRH